MNSLPSPPKSHPFTKAYTHMQIAGDAHIADLESRINVTNAKESEVGFKYNIGNLIGFSARLSKEYVAQDYNLIFFFQCDVTIDFTGYWKNS